MEFPEDLVMENKVLKLTNQHLKDELNQKSLIIERQAKEIAILKKSPNPIQQPQISFVQAVPSENKIREMI